MIPALSTIVAVYVIGRMLMLAIPTQKVEYKVAQLAYVVIAVIVIALTADQLSDIYKIATSTSSSPFLR